MVLSFYFSTIVVVHNYTNLARINREGVQSAPFITHIPLYAGTSSNIWTGRENFPFNGNNLSFPLIFPSFPHPLINHAPILLSNFKKFHQFLYKFKPFMKATVNDFKKMPVSISHLIVPPLITRQSIHWTSGDNVLTGV